MKVAVTTHAVVRYKKRVPGADCLEDETIREIIREKVVHSFELGIIGPHPTEEGRQVIPFKAGASVLYFSVGPNGTSFPGDVAVISVLYEKDFGKVEMGVTLGDVSKKLHEVKPEKKKAPRYAVWIGKEEWYRFQDRDELSAFLLRRKPDPEEVRVYELQGVEINREYVVLNWATPE